MGEFLEQFFALDLDESFRNKNSFVYHITSFAAEKQLFGSCPTRAVSITLLVALPPVTMPHRSTTPQLHERLRASMTANLTCDRPDRPSPITDPHSPVTEPRSPTINSPSHLTTLRNHHRLLRRISDRPHILNLLHHIHPLDHFPEYHVLVIQMRRRHGRDEELTAVCVGAGVLRYASLAQSSPLFLTAHLGINVV